MHGLRSCRTRFGSAVARGAGWVPQLPYDETTRVSPNGRLLDERVEVCQLSEAGACQRALGADRSQDLRHSREHG